MSVDGLSVIPTYATFPHNWLSPSESPRPEGVPPQGLRTTSSCVFEGFSRELSSHYIINNNCNALYSPITYRKVATM